MAESVAPVPANRTRQTRQVFLELQRQIQPGTSNAQFLREWSAKNRVQKRQWTNDRLAVIEQIAFMTGINNRHTDAVQRIQDIPNEANPDIRAFFAACDAASQEKEALSPMFIELSRRWRASEQTELAQPGLNNQSHAHSQGRAVRADAIANTTPRNLEEIRQTRNQPRVPQDAAGNRRMLKARYRGEHRAKELLQARKRHRNAFADAASGNLGLLGNGTWRVLRTFGGRQSRCSVLGLFDPVYDTITDRAFRKDVTLTERQWVYPWMWEGNLRDPDLKTPYEISCQNVMLNVRGCKNVVHFRHPLHRGLIDNDGFCYSLYLGWCQYEDLATFIEQHIRDNKIIPEGMIWNVLEAMADCGYIMEHSTTSATGGSPDWEQIIHRDWKPANVLFDIEDTIRYPSYPKPLLADFGLAIKTTHADKNNPRWYNQIIGTNGFQAPEQLEYIDAQSHRPVDEWRLDEKTNVFGVGMVIWCLITLQHRPPQSIWLGQGQPHDDLDLGAGGTARAKWGSDGQYSQELRDLVNMCISFRPVDRPTFGELLDFVSECTREGPGAANLARSTKGALLGGDHPEAVSFPRDVYRIGLSRDDFVLPVLP